MPAAAVRIALDSPEAVDGRQIRSFTFQDVRLEYVTRTLAGLRIAAPGTRTLVVGGGRGLLPAGLAGLGLDVTAADPSEAATALAREAYGDGAAGDGAGAGAAGGGRSGTAFVTAPAGELPFEDGAFDLAYYADTLEITPDLDRVLAEAARVLGPDGVLLYDTVNRTLVSRLIYLGAFQALPMTRIMPPGRYAAARLRPPAELAAAMARHGLRSEDVCAFKPTDPRSLIRASLARRRGEITDEEIPPMVDFVLAPRGRPVVTYLGYALRAA